MFMVNDTKPLDDILLAFNAAGFGGNNQPAGGKGVIASESNPWANERLVKLAKIYHSDPVPERQQKALRTIREEHPGNFGEGWSVEAEALIESLKPQ